ncbi:MAG: phosphoribosylglycinamide formyltransferase [Balneolaceae bacterium]|nr:phosphoribosylglycinamide formyltransferase [Balneolaceae bacterium]
MKHIVFFASGSGTNFQAVIDAIEAGEINARITGLISNKPDIGAIERAQKHGIPTKIMAPPSFSNQEEYEKVMLKKLKQWQPDLIVLAGYLLKIPAVVIRAYPDMIINIHPSLLPKYGGKGFYGLKVHEAVINAGETETGCSVHVVTENYDEGPVIARRTVPVYPDDTPKELADRVLEQEHQLLPDVIQNFSTNLNQ